jgi:hypothetical protein
MEKVDNDIDSVNDITYGMSNKGKEVMIVNGREIFHKKNCGKRKLNNNYTISWNCKNKHHCDASLTSTRDDVHLEGSDYCIKRKRPHSVNCLISKTDVVVLKHLNYLMDKCKEPGVNQRTAYEGVMTSMALNFPNESLSFPRYDALRSIMSRYSLKHRPRDPTIETTLLK